MTSTFVSRGRCGTIAHTWQAWHNRTSTVVLRGRRGTNSHLPSFCVAGVAQTHIYRRFAWQVWHRWHWVARLDLVWARVTPRHFAWQARHKLTSTVVLRGRRGTNSHLPSFCVAGVAQMALGGALRLGLGARDAAAFCVAGAAQTHIYRRFAWQVWHRWHWVVRLELVWVRVTPRHFAWQAWHKLTSTVVLCGWHWVARLDLVWARVTPRRFAWQARHKLTLQSFCVAGAAQSHIHGRFAWQAWQAWHKLTSTVVLRGRCGTDGTGWRAWTWFGRA